MSRGLDSDEAHVFLVAPETLTDSALLAHLERLLSLEEQERRGRFRFPEGRHEYLVSHALIRISLSRYAPVAPHAWTFRVNEYGRPEIAGPLGAPRLCFNLSHTKGLIACLVALDRDVGVDVEAIERSGDLLEIAARFFAPSEVAALASVDERERRQRFFEYWTLKESYIKARGMGLSLPLAEFAFTIANGVPRIAFTPEIQDEPASWQFELMQPGPKHILAASLRRAPTARVRVAIQQIGNADLGIS
jgi:4'-phosphopantetheinyl transferase